MFEKEAEEGLNRRIGTIGYNCRQNCQKPYTDGFQDGATFAYNKANEWHYVKDGKYPKHEKKVLCILGDFENDNSEVGYYSQNKDEKERWRFENYDLPDDSEDGWGVSAWKEIVLPELPKESE